MRALPLHPLLSLLPFLAGLALAVGCAAGESDAAAPVSAVASVEPLAYLLERVGGERVAVRSLIPAGRSPHDYEPSPGDARALAGVDLLLVAGHPSFAFERRLLERPRHASPSRRGDELSVMQLAGDELAGLEDPHPWLSPPVVARLAEELGDRLGALDPPGAEGYRRRAAELAAEARALDAELDARLAASSCRVFLVDHPAWGALARRYGLEQLALEHDGKEPGPASLARLVERARAARIRLVLVRPGHQAAVRSLARALDAEIEILDPQARDVPAVLRRAAELVTRSCRP